MKLERIRIVVLLPAPLGPRNPTISPLPTSKDMLLIAVSPAYFLVRFSTLITVRQKVGSISDGGILDNIQPQLFKSFVRVGPGGFQHSGRRAKKQFSPHLARSDTACSDSTNCAPRRRVISTVKSAWSPLLAFEKSDSASPTLPTP